MITAKLCVNVNSKYRRTRSVVIETDEDAEELKKAIVVLQKHFDISIELSYNSQEKSVGDQKYLQSPHETLLEQLCVPKSK